GFGKCFVPVAVARLNSDYLHFRILFGKPLPDKLYPFVLVSRTQAGRHDRKLAFAAHDPRGFVSKRFSYTLRGRLIDQKVACVLFRISVPGNNFYSLVARFPQNGRNGLFILDTYSDRVDTARDPRFYNLILLRRI